MGGAAVVRVLKAVPLVLQADTIKQTVADNKVVVYSKTYCPYCTQVSHSASRSAGIVLLLDSETNYR